MVEYHLRPTSSLFYSDSAALLMLNVEQQFHLFCQIQTSQTGGQPCSDTSPFGIGEYTLWPIL